MSLYCFVMLYSVSWAFAYFHHEGQLKRVCFPQTMKFLHVSLYIFHNLSDLLLCSLQLCLKHSIVASRSAEYFINTQDETNFVSLNVAYLTEELEHLTAEYRCEFSGCGCFLGVSITDPYLSISTFLLLLTPVCLFPDFGSSIF